MLLAVNRTPLLAFVYLPTEQNGKLRVLFADYLVSLKDLILYPRERAVQFGAGDISRHGWTFLGAADFYHRLI